ncbi:uncharacterized protein PRCAT00000356001 [Priceomyces carsonii]|uniref:uncharacterized protein n=1 Tax=Priceomyces carsonii TaxID=28549 RepID=UPI002EDA6DFE|nr:unnamed protein product [Priceomyces carsonii]
MTEKKRKSELSGEDEPSSKRPSSTIIGISRSISACQRCRVKKIRCDQHFPKCSKCVKAGVECIGLDPATGREVPRSYICHLEDRISILENKLKESGINPETLKLEQSSIDKENIENQMQPPKIEQKETKTDPDNASLTVYQETSSSISFAKLMATALKVTKKSAATTPDPSISLKFEKVLPAILPPKQTAIEFIKIFFAQANSQTPILHREEFLEKYFVPIYGNLDQGVSLASNYTAINYSVFQNDTIREEDTWFYNYKLQFQNLLKNNTDANYISNNIKPPRQFHRPLFFMNMVFAISSSVHHLQYPTTISESFQTAAKRYTDSVYSSHDLLESLQGILLMALYSTMRPAVPQVWYVLGTALRVCVDLNLHNELSSTRQIVNPFTKDKRRRLFWCTYSMDRQICFYLNRPVGIPDESIDTPFPSELDDALIVPGDNSAGDYSNNISGMPSYKSISLSFFKIRQIQSEVQKILYENREVPRAYKNLNDWRKDIEKKLRLWKNNCPKTPRKMNCDFNLVFFTLNYNHTLLILHGLSPKHYKLSQNDFVIVSESSKELISCYSQLHETKSINYTWAAVHNLFMAGTSYLYTIYNSEEIRGRNSIYEVKKISSECLNVLGSLIDRCDAAFDCRDIFENLTMVVIKLKYNETVHGFSTTSLNEKFSKIDNGNLNSNVTRLVENLNEHNKHIIIPEKSLNPFDHSFKTNNQSLHEESQYAVQKIIETHNNERLRNQSPATFEWITDNNQENMHGLDNGPQYDLNLFFNELENLSPISSNSRRNSIPGGNNKFNFNSNVQSLQDTPLSNDSNMSALSSPVLLRNQTNQNEDKGVSNSASIYPKDGRKVYELIQQMPTESIWDQFFTASASNGTMGLNYGPFVKEETGDQL